MTLTTSPIHHKKRTKRPPGILPCPPILVLSVRGDAYSTRGIPRQPLRVNRKVCPAPAAPLGSPLSSSLAPCTLLCSSRLLDSAPRRPTAAAAGSGSEPRADAGGGRLQCRVRLERAPRTHGLPEDRFLSPLDEQYGNSARKPSSANAQCHGAWSRRKPE
jgi:hypothetical protein